MEGQEQGRPGPHAFAGDVLGKALRRRELTLGVAASEEHDFNMGDCDGYLAWLGSPPQSTTSVGDDSSESLVQSRMPP